ncbi:ATPase, vacuolar ER assembly factor, Vma12 family-containing protein [Aphelenchoides besseyi]|nr:ATPase, vacuolar ER assembly factor, Vma12 family-containing protein [Aphelenchoides besseyi]
MVFSKMAMWLVDEKDRERLRTICGDCKEKVKAEINEIIKKDQIETSEIEKIANLLPQTAPFHMFADRLRVAPRTSVAEESKQTADWRALTQRLRLQQETRDYNRMVSSVDAQQQYGNTNLMQDFGKELKEANRQAIAIFNTLITVAGAFVFGYYGITFAYPALGMSLEARVIVGLILATIVFFADLWFIARSMDQHPQPMQQPKSKPLTTVTLLDANAATKMPTKEVEDNTGTVTLIESQNDIQTEKPLRRRAVGGKQRARKAN